MTQAVSYRLPELPFARLRFVLTAEQSCLLPRYKGSLLRGAFGHALRRTICVMPPNQPCETCMLKQQCAYPRIFETFVNVPAPPFLRGLPTAPRPYVFEPLDLERDYQPGDTLKFDMVLIGQVLEMHPYVIYAVDRMAHAGLGKRRYPFKLQRVDWQGPAVSGPANETEAAWQKLYDGAEKRLIAEVSPQTPLAASGQLPDGAAQLHFLTPTRLKFRNELTMEFTFRMLAFKMLRRVLELAHFHVPDAEIDWEFHDLLVAADEVRITDRKLTWIDWQRRSNRQKTSMKMGGFTGTITLEGPLAPFTALLRTSEVVHVGKAAVFGNGKVKITTETLDKAISVNK